MARIGAEELEHLKRTVDLVALVRSRVELKGNGDDLAGLCPFHVEETPSFHVSVSKNLFHCFGCGAAGSVIDWVMKSKNVSLRHAVEILKADAAVLPGGGRVPVLPPPVRIDADDQHILDDVVSFYHARLKETPEALAYLEKRGLTSAEMIDHFKLGFSDRGLGVRLPSKNRVDGQEVRTRLQRLGIMRASGHEHLTGALVIPILDADGHAQGMYGRKIGATLRKGTPLHLYLAGPHRGVFNVAALKASPTVILCEALIDALTFWCAGFRNVTSAYGVEGFTEEILDAMKLHGTKTVQIAFDADPAGDAAAEKVGAKLMAAGIECYRVQFPRGMDANECGLKSSPRLVWLKPALKQAVKMGNSEAPAMTVTTENAAVKGKAEEEPVVAELPVVQVTPIVTTQNAAVEEKAKEAAPSEPKVATEEVPWWRKAYREDGEDLVFPIEDRTYRVRGFSVKAAGASMRVVVSCERGELFSKDQVEMASQKSRLGSTRSMSMELGLDAEVVRSDFQRMLRVMELIQRARDEEAVKSKNKAAVMTTEEHAAAMALLQDPQLLKRILRDFDVCGVVGEETNKLVGYLAATSRKLDKPLAVMVKSNSGSGKSSLMDAVLAFMPDDECAKYSALTDQSLYYMGETFLKHKILAVVEEEGATNAFYALKLLQSEGKLSIASTSKDPQSGLHQTRDYKVEGPVMIFATTTKEETDPELRNRCIELEADESREQTRAIHTAQRMRHTAQWRMSGAQRALVIRTQKNAQTLLKPLPVWNPYAAELTFPDEKMRLRRDHEKYLCLMDVLALLHQYQRPRTTVVDGFGEAHEAVLVTLDDVEMANKLANEVLGKSLHELPSQTRRLLGILDELTTRLCAEHGVERHELRVTRRQIREHTGWADTQLRVHLERLVTHEYLLVHRGSRGHSFVYELVYDGGGKDGRPFVMGLVNVEALRTTERARMISGSRGSEGEFAGSSRAHSGPIAGGARPDENTKTPHENGQNGHSHPEVAESAYKKGVEVDRSHTHKKAS